MHEGLFNYNTDNGGVDLVMTADTRTEFIKINLEIENLNSDIDNLNKNIDDIKIKLDAITSQLTKKQRDAILDVLRNE